jgi:uncharacterized membrane protein
MKIMTACELTAAVFTALPLDVSVAYAGGPKSYGENVCAGGPKNYGENVCAGGPKNYGEN